MQQLLSAAIDDFMLFRRSQDYSKGTLSNDRSVLRRLLTDTGNVWCHSIGERHLNSFFAQAARTRQPQSIRNDHNILSVFFEWCRLTRRIPADSHPLAGRRRPKASQRERNRVHVSRFPALLDAAGDRDGRDRALIAVLLYTLLRDSDARALRVGDLDLAAGSLRAYIKKTRLEDTMPVCAELDAEMRTWLTIYGERVGGLKDSYYLIPSRISVGAARGNAGRITGHSFEYVPEKPMGAAANTVKPVLTDIGFATTGPDGRPLSEGCHTIRRSGARALFDALVEQGYDGALKIVQSMLHHKSVVQTETYLGITADRRNRDERLRGQLMYPSLAAANVVSLAN